jgi:hypothetical protein
LQTQACAPGWDFYLSPWLITFRGGRAFTIIESATTALFSSLTGTQNNEEATGQEHQNNNHPDIYVDPFRHKG